MGQPENLSPESQNAQETEQAQFVQLELPSETDAAVPALPVSEPPATENTDARADLTNASKNSADTLESVEESLEWIEEMQKKLIGEKKRSERQNSDTETPKPASPKKSAGRKKAVKTEEPAADVPAEIAENQADSEKSEPKPPRKSAGRKKTVKTEEPAADVPAETAENQADSEKSEPKPPKRSAGRKKAVKTEEPAADAPAETAENQADSEKSEPKPPRKSAGRKKAVKTEEPAADVPAETAENQADSEKSEPTVNQAEATEIQSTAEIQAETSETQPAAEMQAETSETQSAAEIQAETSETQSAADIQTEASAVQTEIQENTQETQTDAQETAPAEDAETPALTEMPVTLTVETFTSTVTKVTAESQETTTETVKPRMTRQQRRANESLLDWWRRRVRSKIQANESLLAAFRFIADLSDVFETVLVAVFTVMLVFTFLVCVTSVDGDSMQPTLKSGERLVVSRISHDYERGDILIIRSRAAISFDDLGHLKSDSGLGKIIVKRLIAQGGQTVNIDFEAGIVYVDGEPLDEPYTSTLTNRDEGAFNYPITIPEGYVFVLGDNRSISKDSRHPAVALIPEKDIIGEVLMRIKPFEIF